MENLSFDPLKEVDTSLAEIYLKKHRHFQKVPPQGKCIVFCNGSTDDVEKDLKIQLLQYPRNKTIIDHKIRRKLSEKLEENYELFCQLEYLIRKNDVEDTKNQLMLIQQLLECYDELWNSFVVSIHYSLMVTKETPLYCLGYGLCAIYCGKLLCLYTTMETAPLCHLFYEVCLHAGIDIHLLYINEEDVVNFDKLKSTPEGCTAVYTEHADLESAVDVFLESSPRVPWRIDRILVQESVYEEVMEVFETKGKRVTSSDTSLFQYIEAFKTRRGTVAVTLDKDVPDVVQVATYRTTSDLTALLTARPTHFLSIWCTELAPAMEMAVAVPANFIWIAGFGDFNGPSEVAVAVYTAPLFCRSMDAQCCTQLASLSAVWLTLGRKERKSIVLQTMDKFPMDSDPNLEKAYQSIKIWKPKDPVLVTNDKITFVVDSPDSEVIYVGGDDTNILTAFKLIIRGYSIVVIYCSNCTRDLIRAMNKDGIPILSRKLYDKIEFEKKVPVKAFIGNKKVIQTTFGSINTSKLY